MRRLIPVLVLLGMAAVVVWLWLAAEAGEPAAGEIRLFPTIDARGKAGQFVGCWRTPAAYEKATGKAITAFHQSPFLDGRNLPPIGERMTAEPLVVYPLDTVGKYGGTMNVLSPYGCISNPRILAHDRDYKNVAPDLAKAWRFEDGNKTLIITLRKGLKWSDGHPFTTEDILFWYKHILQNKVLMAELPRELVVGGELVKITKDPADPHHTIRIEAKAPIPLLELHLAHWRGQQSNRVNGFYECAHYMKQFHPDFVGEAEANRKAHAAGFTRWDRLFRYREQSPESPNKEGALNTPTMGPYVLTSWSATRDVLERNPYYYKVDPAGNQLPYIDRMVIHKALTGEVALLKMMNGDVDFDNGLTPVMADAPVLMKYQRRGGYRALMWQRLWGSVVRYCLNLTHDDPVKRKVFGDRRFRIALSVAIDRKEINENLYFENAKAAQATVVPSTKYSDYYEEAFGTQYAEYDPARANRLLDEMGLTQRDEEGYRLGPDGKELTILLYHLSAWKDRPSIHEIVQEYWGNVGVRMSIKTVGGHAVYPAFETGKFDLMYWHMDGVLDVRMPTMPYAFVPMDKRTIWGPKWSRAYLSGKPVTDAPKAVRDLYVWYEKMQQAPTLAERIQYGKKILRSQAENLWSIGTVSMPPHIVIANQCLRNCPEVAPAAWDTFYAAPLPPEAFWFDDPARRNETLRRK